MNKLILPATILAAVILVCLVGAFVGRYAMVPTAEGVLAYRLDRWTGEVWAMSAGMARLVDTDDPLGIRGQIGSD